MADVGAGLPMFNLGRLHQTWNSGDRVITHETAWIQYSRTFVFRRVGRVEIFPKRDTATHHDNPMADPRPDRNNCSVPHPAQQSVIMNCFNGDNETFTSLVQCFEISGLASAYITDLDTDIYKSFGSDWTVFVQDVNTKGGSGAYR
ncbi:hypothetical protein B0H16DRAFT_1799317 [Mycena metata]|uniref:Uncharacterized protein n=1 Tax=Mycena metata TaxID=1033252 RepID=A0AAD7HCY4_9AGAR|nr:hypothetical protein B0H16DRAFT_1799317 [Mycena metata]